MRGWMRSSGRIGPNPNNDGLLAKKGAGVAQLGLRPSLRHCAPISIGVPRQRREINEIWARLSSVWIRTELPPSGLPALLRFSAADPPTTVNLWANSPKLQETGEPGQRPREKKSHSFIKYA